MITTIDKANGFPKTSTQSEYWNAGISTLPRPRLRISKNIDSKWVLKLAHCFYSVRFAGSISKNIDSKWVLKRWCVYSYQGIRPNFQKHRLKVSTETSQTLSAASKSSLYFQKHRLKVSTETVSRSHAQTALKSISKNIDSKWVLKRPFAAYNSSSRFDFQKHRLKVSTETSGS